MTRDALAEAHREEGVLEQGLIGACPSSGRDSNTNSSTP